MPMSRGVRHVVLFGGGGPRVSPLSLSYLGSNASTNDAATHTFEDVGLGDKADIVVCAHARIGGQGTPLQVLSVTVHVPDVDTDPTGTALSEVAQADNSTAGTNASAIFAGPRPDGETGDIVVTWSETALRCKIDRYSKDAHASQVFDTDDTSAAPTATLNVPNGGAVVGCASTASATDATATNLTEDSDTVVESVLTCTCGSSTAAKGNTTFTFTFGNGAAPVGVFAAWGP